MKIEGNEGWEKGFKIKKEKQETSNPYCGSHKLQI
jgi:hypothetical protein